MLFRPGPLRNDEVDKLNWMLQVAERLNKLEVTAPLELNGNILSVKYDNVQIVEKLSDTSDTEGYYPGQHWFWNPATLQYNDGGKVKILNLNFDSSSIPDQLYLGKYAGVNSDGVAIFGVYCCGGTPISSSSSSRSSTSSSSASSSGISSSSSSSSALPCNPLPCNICLGSVPPRWSFNLASFSGICGAAFEGNWTLTQYQTDPCYWLASNVLGAEVVLYFPNPNTIAVIFSYLAGGNTYQLIYEAPFDGDCCANRTMQLVMNQDCSTPPNTFTLIPDCCGQSSSSSSLSSLTSSSTVSSSSSSSGSGCIPGNTCVTCNGATPQTWEVVVGHGTGPCGPAFQGLPWIVTQTPNPCQWSATNSFGTTTTLYFPAPGSIRVVQTRVVGLTTQQVVYQSDKFTGDCCGPYGLKLVQTTNCTGVPGTCEVNPICCPTSSSSSSLSSASITLSSTSSATGIIVDIGCCPNPMPSILLVTFSGASSGCLCLSGIQFFITYSAIGPMGAGWYGFFQACGKNTTEFFLKCDTDFVTPWRVNMGFNDPGSCNTSGGIPEFSCGIGMTLLQGVFFPIANCCTTLLDQITIIITG